MQKSGSTRTRYSFRAAPLGRCHQGRHKRSRAVARNPPQHSYGRIRRGRPVLDGLSALRQLGGHPLHQRVRREHPCRAARLPLLPRLVQQAVKREATQQLRQLGRRRQAGVPGSVAPSRPRASALQAEQLLAGAPWRQQVQDPLLRQLVPHVELHLLRRGRQQQHQHVCGKEAVAEGAGGEVRCQALCLGDVYPVARLLLLAQHVVPAALRDGRLGPPVDGVEPATARRLGRRRGALPARGCLAHCHGGPKRQHHGAVQPAARGDGAEGGATCAAERQRKAQRRRGAAVGTVAALR
mmetsp:Transcript_3764/g.9526  ORF Transcript_3764/g.9526 Transcript_3764/m.9526 type:complete len:296 (+) Transcript_3764:241-1128(+)